MEPNNPYWHPLVETFIALGLATAVFLTYLLVYIVTKLIGDWIADKIEEQNQ